MVPFEVFPLAIVLHKYRKYRLTLYLLFALIFFGMEVLPINENTIITAPQYSINQPGQVLPRLIRLVAYAPEKNGNIMFSKLYIKDNYWRMVAQKGHCLNFAYVLTEKRDQN